MYNQQHVIDVQYIMTNKYHIQRSLWKTNNDFHLLFIHILSDWLIRNNWIAHKTKNNTTTAVVFLLLPNDWGLYRESICPYITSGNGCKIFSKEYVMFGIWYENRGNAHKDMISYCSEKINDKMNIAFDTPQRYRKVHIES